MPDFRFQFFVKSQKTGKKEIGTKERKKYRENTSEHPRSLALHLQKEKETSNSNKNIYAYIITITITTTTKKSHGKVHGTGSFRKYFVGTAAKLGI